MNHQVTGGCRGMQYFNLLFQDNGDCTISACKKSEGKVPHPMEHRSMYYFHHYGGYPTQGLYLHIGWVG